MEILKRKWNEKLLAYVAQVEANQPDRTSSMKQKNANSVDKKGKGNEKVNSEKKENKKKKKEDNQSTIDRVLSR